MTVRLEDYAPVAGNGAPATDDPLRAASELLALEDPFVGVERALDQPDAPMTATTASGVRVRWERQVEAMERRTLVRPLLAAGLRPPPKKLDCERFYALLVRAATTGAAYDAQDETRDWLHGFEQMCEPREADFSEPTVKFAHALDLNRERVTMFGEAFLLLVDTSSGLHYARRGDVALFVRKGRGVTISGAALTGRLAEIGAEAFTLQMWQPDVPRDEAILAYARTYRWRP